MGLPLCPTVLLFLGSDSCHWLGNGKVFCAPSPVTSIRSSGNLASASPTAQPMPLSSFLLMLLLLLQLPSVRPRHFHPHTNFVARWVFAMFRLFYLPCFSWPFPLTHFRIFFVCMSTEPFRGVSYPPHPILPFPVERWLLFRAFVARTNPYSSWCFNFRSRVRGCKICCCWLLFPLFVFHSSIYAVYLCV